MLTTVAFAACSIFWRISTNDSHFKCQTFINENCTIDIHCDTGFAEYQHETKTFKQDIYKFNFDCTAATKTFYINDEIAAVAGCKK